jgi:histidyl-tRNA synthetase
MSGKITFRFLPMQRLGLTHEDIKIRINNRRVLQTVAQQCEIPEERFSTVCVILDKLEKIPEEQVHLPDNMRSRQISFSEQCTSAQLILCHGAFRSRHSC